MRDKYTNERIKTLHPDRIQKFTDFIEELENDNPDIDIRITQAFRSFDEQNKLYAQGRTSPGKISTAAKGGESCHCYGMAIDIVPIKEGQPDWNFDFSKFEETAKKYNLEWGAPWKDNDHYEDNLGLGGSVGWKAMLKSHLHRDVDKNGFIILSSIKDNYPSVASA